MRVNRNRFDIRGSDIVEIVFILAIAGAVITGFLTGSC